MDEVKLRRQIKCARSKEGHDFQVVLLNPDDKTLAQQCTKCQLTLKGSE